MAILAFQGNDKVKFKGLNFHLCQIFVWSPPVILSVGIHVFSSTENKNPTPWRLLVRKCFCKAPEETALAQKNQRSAFCWWTKGLTFCTKATMKIRAQAAGSLVQSHTTALSHSAPSSCSRENKHEWYKNTQRRWLWVVCPRKTNTAWPVGEMADNKTR